MPIPRMSTKKTITREIDIAGMKAFIEGESEEELDRDEAECREFCESCGNNRETIMKQFPIFDAQRELCADLKERIGD